MRALICSTLNGPEALEIGQLPAPQPGPGELRIRVACAALNFPDGLIVQGRYQFKPDLPFIPGSEAAGVVDAIGAGVEGFAIGQRVACTARFGAFAAQMVAPASASFGLSEQMTFDDGAAFGMAYGTSYHALVQRGTLRAGETVLVLGAGGGVGFAAVQIAKALGARVIAGASSARKLALAREAGADVTIDYAKEDLRQAVKAATEGRGADIIYDPVGGAVAEPAMRAIAWGGRYLVIGFASGTIPALPVNLALIKNAMIVGVFWGAWSDREPQRNKENFDALLQLYDAGKLRPPVSQCIALADTPAAIRRLLDGQLEGKVVVRIGEAAGA